MATSRGSEVQGSDNVTGSSDGQRLDEWETMFPNGDGALLPWIVGESEAEDPCFPFKHLLLHSSSLVDYDANPNTTSCDLGVVDQAHPSFDAQGQGLSSPPDPPASPLLPHPPAPAPAQGNINKISALLSPNSVSNNCLLNYPHQYEVADEKPQIFNPQLSNPSFFMPPFDYSHLDQHLLQSPSKHPNLIPFMEHGHDFLLRKQHQHQHQPLPFPLPPQFLPPHLLHKPMMVPKQTHHQHQHQQQIPLPVLQQQLQEQSIKDQLFKAADLLLTGNFSLAQEILARLNHQLLLPTKPLTRAALYVKEALQMLLLMGNPVAAPPPKNLTPYDVVHKMNAYKVFSEVSPIAQFVNFTSTQVILEALDDADAIHIIDFDIGCGAQWASFIQELPSRKRGPPSLKITALAPLSTTHLFELALVRENLVQFAHDIGLVFELQVMNLDLFDPSSCTIPNFRTSEDEAIAVNIPIWALSNQPSNLPSILEFIKQRSSKIVVSFDRGFDRCDVPFPQHLVHTLDSCTNFLESLDGLNVAADIVNKIGKFFIQPRIENTLLGRVHYPEKMPHWKNLFNSAGFLPVQFSNFTETQADYVVKKIPGKGFNVEKRQSSLVLSWQRRELVAASAWKC